MRIRILPLILSLCPFGALAIPMRIHSQEESGWARRGKCTDRHDATRTPGVRRKREVAPLRVVRRSTADLPRFVDEVATFGKEVE